MAEHGRQLSFLAGADDPPMGLKLIEQCKWVLERHPLARDDYRLQTLLVWDYFYNLKDNLETIEKFTMWFTHPKTPMAKSIRERTREIQLANAHLEPSPSVKKERQRKSRRSKPPGT